MTTALPDMGAVGTSIKTRLTNLENSKAPKESPTFTGCPIAPTAATGTSNTQIANTAFVQQELADPKAEADGVYQAFTQFNTENGVS